LALAAVDDDVDVDGLALTFRLAFKASMISVVSSAQQLSS
jgi:hypothetical protein